MAFLILICLALIPSHADAGCEATCNAPWPFPVHELLVRIVGSSLTDPVTACLQICSQVRILRSSACLLAIYDKDTENPSYLRVLQGIQTHSNSFLAFILHSALEMTSQCHYIFQTAGGAKLQLRQSFLNQCLLITQNSGFHDGISMYICIYICMHIKLICILVYFHLIPSIPNFYSFSFSSLDGSCLLS